MLPVHITAGLIGIASGAVALYAIKGARVHRQSGMIFVYAILVMSATGAVMSMLMSQRLNMVMGVLTFYLVSTALRTVRRRADGSPWIDVAAMLVALAVGLYEIGLGAEAVHNPRGKIDGMPPAPALIFGSLALLAALGDVRMLLAGGLQGTHRMARHLWRMCFAMFIATGSFFLGQAKVFPPSIRIVPLLAIPVLLVVVLMLYWLARVLFTERYRSA
jgi:uncharacterized membrane protein